MQNKLSKISNLMIIACYSFILFLTSVILILASKTKERLFVFPTGEESRWIMLLSIIFFVGDFLYFLAYNNGGKAELGVAIYALAPMFVFLVNAIQKKEYPSITQFIGYALLFVAILFITSEKK